MKLSDELVILQVPMMPNDATSIMNISLIVDPGHGLTLVDTGLPSQADTVADAIAAEGFDVADVKQIVLTHQDIDHVGALNPIKGRTGATVLALEEDVPYIDGRKTLIKMPTPERLAANPIMAERMQHYRSTDVDVELHDGEVLDKASAAVVIATPGHTPGHMSLYLPASKTLIAGDAMVAENGTLQAPVERATPNMALAMQSLKKLLHYDIQTIVCYHGGLVDQDAMGQLRRVIDAAPVSL